MRNLWYWWSFDVMGELMFSKSLQTLTDERSRGAVSTLRIFMRFLGPLSPSPWIINLGSLLPGVFWGWNRMIAMCDGYMKEKIEVSGHKSSIDDHRMRTNIPNQSKEPPTDIASRVVHDSRSNKALNEDRYALSGDSLAMAIADSDTLACTLVYAFSWLAREPRHQDATFRTQKPQYFWVPDSLPGSRYAVFKWLCERGIEFEQSGTNRAAQDDRSSRLNHCREVYTAVYYSDRSEMEHR
jgi:tryprostatin B 6-hydroxylase